MEAVYLMNTTNGLTQSDLRETQVEVQVEVGNKAGQRNVIECVLYSAGIMVWDCEERWQDEVATEEAMLTPKLPFPF